MGILANNQMGTLRIAHERGLGAERNGSLDLCVSRGQVAERGHHGQR